MIHFFIHFFELIFDFLLVVRIFYTPQRWEDEAERSVAQRGEEGSGGGKQVMQGREAAAGKEGAVTAVCSQRGKQNGCAVQEVQSTRK